MKKVITGLESSGKSLWLARKSMDLLKRNKKWEKKYGFTRPIYSNMKWADNFKKENERFLKYFDDKKEIIGKQGCDIIWDELSTSFPASKREPLNLSTNKWLRQGAKQGVHIFGSAQEFHDIHVDFRRRTKVCKNIKKVMGSRRGGKNLPEVKFIWGICLLWEIDIHPYNELDPQRKSLLPAPLFITKDKCEIFDTHQVIKSDEEQPLEHIERHCPVCGYDKVYHR